MKKLMLCLLAFTGLNANVALAEETSVPEFARFSNFLQKTSPV